MPFTTRAVDRRAPAVAQLYDVAKVLLVAAMLLTGIAIDAQEKSDDSVPTIKKDVNVVNVLATVRNKQGQIVNTLTQADFKLEVDGKPESIKYFSRVSDLPLSLGLLVDTSYSQRRLLDKERTASYVFLNDLLNETRDKAFVIHFDFDVELMQDLTGSRPKLQSALQKLEVPQPRQMQTSDPNDPGQSGGTRRGGGTKLYDSIFLACDEITDKVKGRKALIILSDGVDQGSKVSMAHAIEAAQRSNTLVYTILFADPDAYNNVAGGPGGRHGGGGGYPGGGWPGGGYPGGRHGGGYPGGGGGYPGGGGGGGGRGGGGYSHADGKVVMQRLAQQTGGRFFEVSKKESIDDIYKTIGEELRNQYNLGFTPEQASAPDVFHTITLTTTQKDLTVQAREGYYSSQ